MLVLSRHKGEKVVIDLRSLGLGLIEVCVVEIRGSKNWVRLGFEVDPRLPVHRQEVFDDIERSKPTEPTA